MTRRRVTLGLVQYAMTEDAAANTARALRLTRAAARRGAQVICLPELYNSPYFPQAPRASAARYAEPVPGPSVASFSRLARERGVVVVLPLFERARGGKFYNTAVVIDADGRALPAYRKVHIPQDPLFYEKNYFAPGDRGFRVHATRYAKVAPMICYDQWFPETARAAMLAGAELVLYPTAIGAVRGAKAPEGDWREAWTTIQRAHAIANSVHVAAVNRVGTEGRLRFWGASFVSDAFGNVLAQAGGKTTVLVARVDLAQNESVAAGWGFRRNRRPDAYRALAALPRRP